MAMQQPYRKPLLIAVVLHVFIFILLAMGFQITGKNYVVENYENAPIVTAMVMNAPPSPPQPQVVPAPPVQAAPKPVPPPPPVKQVAAAKPIVIPPKPEVIAIDVKKQKKLRQEQLEKQLLADLKKTKAIQKNLKQKSLEQAFANEIKNLSKKKQASREQSVVGDKEQHSQGEIDKYKALVLQVIGHHWLIPANADKNLATKLMIYLAPGGTVLDVEIYESSGNPALDTSARAAVFKASPLPVPSDAERFKFFKSFVLVFRPIYFQNGQFDS